MKLIKFFLMRTRFAYRNILSEIAGGILFIIIQFSFFKNFITTGTDYNDTTFFIYIVVSFIITSCCSSTIVEYLCAGYQRNSLSNKFISERSLYSYLVINTLIEKICMFLFFSCLFIGSLLAIKKIDMSFFARMYFFIPSLILAFLLDIFMRIIIASILITNRSTQSILKAYNQVVRILSGAIVPISFFPAILGAVIFYLPFYYLLFYPLDVLLIEFDMSGLIIQSGLTLILFIVSVISFKQMEKRLKREGGL